MAVVIAAPASGSGKTLLTLSLLAWARAQGHSIQPFKVGPDYLDPQLLSAAAGHPCRNLDINLCGEAWVERAFTVMGVSEIWPWLRGSWDCLTVSAAVKPAALQLSQNNCGCRWFWWLTPVDRPHHWGPSSVLP